MKILLVGNYLPDKQESMLRFTDLLVDALKPYNHEVKLIRPAVKMNRSHSGYESKGKWWGYIDKFLIFPFQLKKEMRWADIVHVCDHSNAYYINFLQKKPHIINCHDVIAIRAALDPANQNIKKSGKILQGMIVRGLKKAAYFACISKNTRDELIKVVGIAPEKAVVIYMGLNYPFKRMAESEAKQLLSKIEKESSKSDWLSKPFLLHVGGNQPYKNRIGVLKIYHQLRALRDGVATPKLVLVGKPWNDEMRRFVADNVLQDSVVEIQNCSNEEMRAVYSLAQAFLFPSLAEGFGWPVIEAQACGCPVLTSNFAPLTEVGGDAALYCDPRDELEFARQFDELLNEPPAQRAVRIKEGLKNVERFTPQTMSEAYLAHYQKAIDNYGSSPQ